MDHKLGDDLSHAASLCRNGFGDVIGTVNLDWNRGLEGTEWEPLYGRTFTGEVPEGWL